MQMLAAQAVPVLVGLLEAPQHHFKSAELLCLLAREQTCKDAFLEQSILAALVASLRKHVVGEFTF